MCEIVRREIDENWADAGVVEAGDFIFVGYCMKREGESIEAQINGAFDVLEERLGKSGLTLEAVKTRLHRARLMLRRKLEPYLNA